MDLAKTVLREQNAPNTDFKSIIILPNFVPV